MQMVTQLRTFPDAFPDDQAPWPLPAGTTAKAALQNLTGRRLAFLLVIAGVTISAQAVQGYGGKVSQVSDGDTLWVLPEGGGPARKIRIDGIDAPELCQPGGAASRAALAQRALNRHAQVQVRRRDDYGRELARVRIDGQDVGAQMVREGQAWSYRWRRDAGPYAAEEAQAQQARRGLFAMAGPERPRDFRRRHGPCPAPVR